MKYIGYFFGGAFVLSGVLLMAVLMITAISTGEWFVILFSVFMLSAATTIFLLPFMIE